MERIPIRTRESALTLSAWRIQLPAGAIVLVDIGGKAVYRAEGALLGSPQDKLAQLWQAALPQSEPESENPPLG